MEKIFWREALKQFGIGAVFLALLIFYYQTENAKWEKNQTEANRRWEQLFQKYSDDQHQSLETVRECCRVNNAGTR